MKKIVVLLVVVVAFVAVAPFVNGLMMEKAVYKQLERTKELYAENSFSPQIDILRYERGYASTDIEWTITLPHMSIEEVGPVVLDAHAKHGLFGASSTVNFEQNSWFSEFVEDELGGDNPLSVTMSYNLFGGAKAVIAVESFEWAPEEENSLVFSSGEIVIKIDSQIENVETHGYIDGFSIPGNLEVGAINLDADLKLISEIISEGETSIKVEKVVINDDMSGVLFSLSDLVCESVVDVDDAANTLSISIHYGVDEIVADGVYEDLSASLSLNQLDIDVLESIYSLYTESLEAILLSAQDGEEGLSEQADFEMGMLGLRLVPELEKLLKKDLEIAIDDVHLSLPDGEVDGAISIALKKDMTLAGFMGLVSDPQQLVDIFRFSSEVTLPDGLVPDQDALLFPMLPGMPGGVFEAESGVLTHKAEIKDEKLYLNGQEFVLEF